MKNVRLLFALFLSLAGTAAVANPDGAGMGNAPVANATTAPAPVALPAPQVATMPAPAPAAAVPATAPVVDATHTPAARSQRQSRVANRVREGLRNSSAALQAGPQAAAKPSFLQRVAGKLVKLFNKAIQDETIVVALLLWFFLGSLAIHRVYLGTKPIMILWYFLTCGGIFGLCVLFDLIMMIVDFDRMKDNNKFFSIAK